MNISKWLVITLVACFLGAASAEAQQASCKPIIFSLKQQNLGAKGATIMIDLKGQNMGTLSVNLVKPKGEFLLDVKELEFNNLKKGEYTVVVTGRYEADNYCPAYSKIIVE